jgi:hypothetical protein
VRLRRLAELIAVTAVAAAADVAMVVPTVLAGAFAVEPRALLLDELLIINMPDDSSAPVLLFVIKLLFVFVAFGLLMDDVGSDDGEARRLLAGKASERFATLAVAPCICCVKSC